MTKGDPCQQTTQIYAQLWRWFLMPQTTVTHKTGLSIWWFQKISITYERLTSCLHEMVFCYQNCSDLCTVRKNCSRTREKILKLEGKVREFAKFLRSLEQFIQTVKGRNNFW